MDDQFVRGLQQMQENGQITEEVFASMLANYLTQVGTAKKAIRKPKEVGLHNM